MTLAKKERSFYLLGIMNVMKQISEVSCFVCPVPVAKSWSPTKNRGSDNSI